MDSKTFWTLVDEKKAELLAAHKRRKAKFWETNDPEAWEGQPRSGSGVILISVGAATAYLAYCEPTRRAAQLVVEGLYKIATAAEIKRHQATEIHQFKGWS